MPNLSQSPSTDKRSVTEIVRFRTTPDPSAWTRTDTYAVDTYDGDTIEVNRLEWRQLLEQVQALPGRRTVHRHLGTELECKGVLLEVIQ